MPQSRDKGIRICGEMLGLSDMTGEWKIIRRRGQELMTLGRVKTEYNRV